ncbi:MAG: DUF5979 domain-containing protein [Olegusella sp.]|nr:DUF5979 domain-containing protein [Olegusella sp.]
MNTTEGGGGEHFLSKVAVLAIALAVSLALVPGMALADDASKTLTVGPTGDYASIQEAIDYIAGEGTYKGKGAADKSGWTITLQDDQYTRFKVHSSVTNLTVTGGKGAVINVLDGTPDPTTKAAPDTGGINIQQTQGFTLKGVTVNCGGDTAWPHFAITNFGNAGGGNGLTVDDVHFTGTAGSALLLSSGMKDFSVTNCTFASGIDTAINVMNDNTPAGTVTITGNKFDNNNFAVHGYWGGSNGGALTMTGNTITGGDKRSKVVIQDQENKGAVKPSITGNTMNSALVGLINLTDDGATAAGVLQSNTVDAQTFAADGLEPGTLDFYSSYVVNQGSKGQADYKFGRWVISGLDSVDWSAAQKAKVEEALADANAKQSPVLNITGLEDGTLIHTFTWFKDAIYWEPYENGKLTISKALEGNALEDNDKNDEFTFKITLTGADVPSGKQTYGVQGIGSDIKDEGVTFTDGVATITLKGGESKTIEGIPAGTAYTVEEQEFSDPDDELTYTTDPESRTISGTIVKNKEQTASFTNKKWTYGKLTVSKTLAGNALEANDTSDEFTFTIQLTGDYIKGEQEFGGVTFIDGVAEVTLKGGESITLDDIPSGTSYSVEEEPFNDANDVLIYTTTVEGEATGTIKADKETTVSFTNSKDKEPEPAPKPSKPSTPKKTVRRPIPQTSDDSISGAGFAVAGVLAVVTGMAIRRKQHLS